MTTRREVIDSINSGVEHVERTFAELSDRDLDTRVDVDGRDDWTARDLLGFFAGREHVYETLIRMTEFDQMPDMFEYGQDHISRQEADVRMTRDSFDRGGQGMARRPGTFDLSDPEWEYSAATPHAGKSTRELLAEFRRVHDNLIDRVQGMPDELLNKPSPVGDSDESLADTLKDRAGDFLHEHVDRVDRALSSASR